MHASRDTLKVHGGVIMTHILRLDALFACIAVGFAVGQRVRLAISSLVSSSWSLVVSHDIIHAIGSLQLAVTAINS